MNVSQFIYLGNLKKGRGLASCGEDLISRYHQHKNELGKNLHYSFKSLFLLSEILCIPIYTVLSVCGYSAQHTSSTFSVYL